MSALRFFGFVAEDQQRLVEKVEATAQPAPQGIESTTLVVSVQAARDFIGSAEQAAVIPDSADAAVLWVPKGQTPLPFDSWVEEFHIQLSEESEADCEFLKRVSQCHQVLSWNDRVEDIPADWYFGFKQSPANLPPGELPFPVDQRRHLAGCRACQEEVRECLQFRFDLRRALLCPSVDELADWLEGKAPLAPKLLSHIPTCQLCQEWVKRQAWLWEGAGLLTKDQVSAKFAEVGITP